MDGTASRTTSDVTVGTPHAVDEPREWGWLLRVLAVVAVFALVTVFRSHQVDIPFRDPGGKLFTRKILGSAWMLPVLVVVDIGVRWWRGRNAGATPWRTARTRWTPYRLGLIALGLLAYHVVYLCYRSLKSWDVFLTPRDEMLLRWDRALTFGHSPAVLLHDLLGQDVAARVLSALYEFFPTLLTLALVSALAFAPTVRSSYVFVAAGMWAWILGVGSYYLIPSLGPFHSAPAEFAGLTRTSIQSTQAEYVAQRAHMLAHPHAGDAFAQISAFASLHCALTFLVFLMARYYGLRRISWFLGLFLVGTVLATVYLGWHFAVDDIAGLTLGWVAVQLGKLTVDGTVRSPSPTPANP